MKPINKRWMAAVLLVMMVLLLTSCKCDHEWQEATCLTPKTCTRCGLEKGGIAPHIWGDTTCTSPAKCIVCGTMDGIELSHEWGEDIKICTRCGFDGRTVDERFIDELGFALEETWALTGGSDGTVAEGEAQLPAEIWEQSFNAEAERLSSFRNETFENEELGMWAGHFIDTIDESKAVLEYSETVHWFNQYSYAVYYDRSVALYKINELAPVSVSDEYAGMLEDILAVGASINEINLMCEEINFHSIGATRGKANYEAFLTNTTSFDFKTFELKLKMIDKNGEVVLEEEMNMKNWEPGEEKRLKFSSDIEFVEIRPHSAVWTF